MKYLLLKNVRPLIFVYLAFFAFGLAACKKEVATVTIDAFAKLNNELKYNQGIYTLAFTLQEYPYKEVGVRIGTSKTAFHKNQGLTIISANPMGPNRYGVFLNSLAENSLYYYQIYVKDSASDKEVYSDLYSFTTKP